MNAEGVLPEATEAVISAMVAEFKDRHQTGEIDVASVEMFDPVFPRLLGTFRLGALYLITARKS